MNHKLLIAIMMVIQATILQGQQLRQVDLDFTKGMAVTGFSDGINAWKVSPLPLVSFRCGETLMDSRQAAEGAGSHQQGALLANGLEISVSVVPGFSPGWKAEVTIRNTSRKDTIEVWNVVPFGEDPGRVHITGLGRHRLSRTHLFRPGQSPVNVIVPDNAWDLGFSEVSGDGYQVCALVRRTGSGGAQIKRFENILFPGGSVTYSIWADLYKGDWQEGLRVMFQERLLYDLESFDQSLYERPDLKWIRHTYASHLLYGWDHQYFDSKLQKNNLEEFILRGKKWYGGDDFIGIWPTWPSLGLDQRNQWDLFRDMPGGLDELRSVAEMCRSHGARFFICYNPWDEDTRSESHYTGMADLIRQTTADGVVLDTKGSSSLELQWAADSVRSGVVMYSEGMAVPRDMPGIVSGRVHNALYYPPLLNLNKFIKPEFAIYRVAELAYEPIRREYATSFFNGYGTELNIFKPGRPDWIESDYRFFGRTLMVLREHTSNFVRREFIPLIPTLQDQVFVNCWPSPERTVYTIFSVLPEGFEGPLFEVHPEEGYHYVDVWEHRELELVEADGKYFVPVRTDAFHRSWLGTNNEGAVSAVVRYPVRLSVDLNIDRLTLAAAGGELIRIWAGDPDYEKEPAILKAEAQTVRLGDLFGRFEGDFIIQLMEDGEVVDERIVHIPPGTPRLVSESVRTVPSATPPAGMVTVPEGTFDWKTTNGDDFISYPKSPYRETILMSSFYMDKHPVTNKQYAAFIEATGYAPSDTANFLKNWVNGRPPRSLENHPVTYVSYEDAKAYAAWAGKRLPTELEWQYAAQTPDLRPWPWGGEEGITRELQWVTNTLTVSKIKGIDKRFCNLGNGTLDPVGRYPRGANPYGLEDLVGSVWQLTNDEYDNDSNHYVMMKGGSYFSPGSS
ncbi:MAG: SUMF1/EgtB/PvdO family nonheme iron enzyme [Bacteroidales bacterium]